MSPHVGSNPTPSAIVMSGDMCKARTLAGSV